MVMLKMVFETLVVIAAALLLAGVMAAIFWTGFKLIRCPEAGPATAVCLIAMAFHDRVHDSLLIQLTILFGLLIAALGTIEGGIWRAAHPRRR